MVELSELFVEDIAVWILVLFALILAGVGVGVAFKTGNNSVVRHSPKGDKKRGKE